MSKNTIFKCPFCNKKYLVRTSLYNHIEDEHKELLGKLSPAHYLFNLKYHKTKGQCIICKKETPWNERLERYDRLCSEKCKEEYRKLFKERMMKRYGKVTLLDEPEQQKKLLSLRHISGKYKFSDGIFVEYTGSYERDFLHYIDTVLDMEGKDIIGPAPQVFYYEDTNSKDESGKSKKRFYIPDFYIPALNLLVEIKDGGDNPNKHEYRTIKEAGKEHIKDILMKKQTDYNFIKVINKDYDKLNDMIQKIKNQQVLTESTGKKEIFKDFGV